MSTYSDEDYDCKPDSYFRVLRIIAIFSASACFGALGSALSVISRARSAKFNEIITTGNLYSIQTVGAVFAIVLTLMFMGGLIGGTLFPNADNFYQIIYVAAAFPKLLVWSFIAGFSERIVPNILNNLINSSEINKDKGSN
ncbi:hypothetical protein F4U02_04725 [Acinetobacter haemolyticus]|uniref:hypothetical protein n=1 Tax=Acinetobacter haemolyticus TaxID=29430 RepID=UPI00129871FE|nr:hypothetical protein [Acinetobacter haemolyticus]MQZ30309.1 hypothetical protein [Acinetobacter haemolyticus]